MPFLKELSKYDKKTYAVSFYRKVYLICYVIVCGEGLKVNAINKG